MSYYALIEDGFVVNVVVWDGTGDIFNQYDSVEITDEQPASTGDAWLDGKIITRPDSPHDYVFNAEGARWELTPEGEKQKRIDDISQADAEKSSRISYARGVIGLWQTELALGSISDDDRAKLVQWVNYIKLVSAVDTSTAPYIEWPPQPQL